MKRIIVHVGIHKTATTFLQERCFPQLTGVHFVHHQNYTATPATGIVGLLSGILERDTPFLDLDQEKRALTRMLAAVPEPLVLISLERLFGNMYYNFYNNGHITRCLGHLVPDASIVVVIRRQDDLLESLYRQCLRRYFSPTVDGYLNYVNGEFQNRDFRLVFPSMNARRLDLYRYVRNYAATFGRDNVLVLPYEKLRSDRDGFLTDLYGFMQVEPFYPTDHQRLHQSYTPLSCRIARLVNHAVRSDWREPRRWQVIPERPFSGYLSGRGTKRWPERLLARIDRGLSVNHVLENVVDRIPQARRNMISDQRRRLIMELHGESNRALDEEFGLGLAEYGYY